MTVQITTNGATPNGATPNGATPGRSGPERRLHTVGSILAATDARLAEGHTAGARVWPTGFDALDHALVGGFRSGELVLLGGPQGLGKTAMALQMLRNAVHLGRPALFFSYEHDVHSTLERLIAIEAAEAVEDGSVELHAIRQAFESRHTKGETVSERLSDTVGGVEAVRAIESYADRLHIHASSGVHTTIDEIRATILHVISSSGQRPFVVIDYRQTVPVAGGLGDEERAAATVEALKDLALDLEVPLVAIVVADKSSLVSGKRMRVNDLRGSSALAYEADIVLILNNKFDIVARHHLVYHLGNAERFRQWVVMTIEKNRNGVDHVELEFLKRFEQGRFDPEGRPVAEQLIEERIYTE